MIQRIKSISFLEYKISIIRISYTTTPISWFEGLKIKRHQQQTLATDACLSTYSWHSWNAHAMLAYGHGSSGTAPLCTCSTSDAITALHDNLYYNKPDVQNELSSLLAYVTHCVILHS